MFSERPVQPHHLQDTLDHIDQALAAPDFNEEDRAEVEANRVFFEQHRDRFMVAAGQTIKSAELAA